jgi:hypothetical protein
MLHHLHRLGALMAIFVFPPLAGCGPIDDKARVHVTYEQVADFQSYRLASNSSGSYAASPDGLFIMYRITRIDNRGAHAEEFVFDEHEVVLVTDSAMTNEGIGFDKHTLLGGQLASPITVGAGQVLSKPKGLGCIIKVARADHPKDLVGKMIDPLHKIDPSQPVSMSRSAGNTSESTVIGDALPSTLQALCNTQ